MPDILHWQVSGYGNKWIRGDGNVTRITKQQVEKSVDDSLKRLKTDYVDLLQACAHLTASEYQLNPYRIEVFGATSRL